MENKDVFDRLNALSEGMDEGEVKRMEKNSRIEAIRSLVTNTTKIYEKDGKEAALEYAENTVLGFTATCNAQGTFHEWLPFIVDSILVSPDRVVQGILRNAGNTSMKGLILELSDKFDVNPLSEMFEHMMDTIKEKLDDPESDILSKLEEKLRERSD